MNYGTWNKITITGSREMLLQLRDETFSVDPEASPDEALKRMALDLNKISPKPERLADHEALFCYVGWCLEQGGTMDEAIDLIGCDDHEWITLAKQYAFLDKIHDVIFFEDDPEFVQVGVQLMKDADPNFHAKALNQWCYKHWRVQHNTCMRYGGTVTPNSKGDGTWLLQCRFDTEWLLMPVFELLVRKWPKLEFRIVSCVLSDNYAVIGVGRSGEFIHQGTNQFCEVLANEFEYLVPKGFSVDQYVDLWCQFPSTYFAPYIGHNQTVVFDHIDSSEIVF